MAKKRKSRKKPESEKQKVGRKWFDGKDEDKVIANLMQVWGIGGSDAEAAFYADITTCSLSRYLTAHPEISQRKTSLLNKPILKARQEVVKGLDARPEFSLKYLEKKRSDEFSSKYVLDIKGVNSVIAQIISVIDIHVKDADTKLKIAEELKNIKF